MWLCITRYRGTPGSTPRNSRFTLYAHVLITTAMPFNCRRSICICAHCTRNRIYTYMCVSVIHKFWREYTRAI